MLNLSYAMTQSSKYTVEKIYTIESKSLSDFNCRCQAMIEQSWIPASDLISIEGYYTQQWIKQRVRNAEDD